MQRFTIDKNNYDETKLNKDEILQLIRKHQSLSKRIAKNLRYYEGKHMILNRKRKKKEAPNNKVICNHAKDITDTATGYFLSSAVTFNTGEENVEALDKLTDAFDLAEVDEVDHDNALDMSRAGVAYEYVYVKEGTTILTTRNVEPTNTFIVCDDTIESNELFGVYYFRYKDALTDKYKYKVTVGTANYIYNFTLDDIEKIQGYLTEGTSHFLGAIPFIEYRNNKESIGDYEQQLSLIDAYNTLMSDRINDKEQFIDALLIIYGSMLTDEDEKKNSEAMKILREEKILEMPEGAKAEYLTRTFDETGIAVLRKAIKEDIYTFSHVPNLTDENFAGNSSGVAMEYKLLGLEMITKTKQRYYTKGLKKRITLFCNYLGLKSIAINPTTIVPTFTRGLPKNTVELAQMVSNLDGFVSQGTLISQLPFVEDPDGEIEKVKEEKKESIKQQQKMFESQKNEPFFKEEEEVREDEE